MYPILYQGHDLIIYSYPLFMGLGWGFAYQIYFGLMNPSVSRLKAQILFWGVFLSSWIGAKLFFLLTYPKDLSSIAGEMSFWMGGGFVFYGGLLGALIFLLIYRIWEPLREENFWPMLPALTFGHAVGRVGCLLAGCCFGTPTTLPWGIFLHGEHRHPTQILEILVLSLMGFVLLKSKKPKSELLVFYFVIYGLSRFGIEFLRGDIIRGEWFLLSPSQWISLALVILGLGLFYKIKHSRALA